MIDFIWSARVTLTLINLSLIFLLISIYLNEYKKINSPITLGFLLFVIALFSRTLFAGPLIRVIFVGTRISSVADPYRLVGDFFELFALCVLLYLSTRDSELSPVDRPCPKISVD